MSAVETITIKGFKSIRSIDRLRLNPINVLIGSNGSGKSSFLSAFQLLRAEAESNLKDFVRRNGGANRLLHFGARTTREMEFRFEFGSRDEYHIFLDPVVDDNLYARTGNASRNGFLAVNAGGDLVDAALATYEKLSECSTWNVYHFEDTTTFSPLRRTGELNDNRLLRHDGSNLAAFLYLLKARFSPEYGLIRRAVQRIAPYFDDFVLAPSNLNPDSIRLEWRHVQSDQYFDASSLSDGTLRFVALATLLLQPRGLQPSIILIDEPELGLHPSALALFASLVKSICRGDDPAQVIISTQSSTLLDHFDPEDVLVADLVEGGTTLRRLEAQPLADWLDEYSLGQLWEKNEIGGRP